VSPEWSEWKRAIETELDQLNCMGTWKLVEKPPGVIPIANKFVFAKKRDKDGNLQKYKARLVAKGCAQHPGYDFLETHSPVVSGNHQIAVSGSSEAQIIHTSNGHKRRLSEWYPKRESRYETAQRL